MSHSPQMLWTIPLRNRYCIHSNWLDTNITWYSMSELNQSDPTKALSLFLSRSQSEDGVWKAGHREDRNTETLCHGKTNTHQLLFCIGCCTHPNIKYLPQSEVLQTIRPSRMSLCPSAHRYGSYVCLACHLLLADGLTLYLWPFSLSLFFFLAHNFFSVGVT